MLFVPSIQRSICHLKILTVKKLDAVDSGINTKIIEKCETATISAMVS